MLGVNMINIQMGQVRKYRLSRYGIVGWVLMMFLIPIHGIWAQHDHSDWWNHEFIIGMYMDPPQKTGITGWRADTLWNAARDAGFNLATGVQYAHGYQCDSVSPMWHARNSNIRLLYFDKHLLSDTATSILELESLLSNTSHSYSGVNVKDEPKEEYFDRVNAILKLADRYNQHLFFVNLFPFYYKGNWQAYEDYVNLFVNDSVPLKVVCFDNYFPHTEFTNSTKSRKYYSNIAYLRKVCGERPLWSYVLTTEEKLDSSNEEWQKAFLRLSAFVPLAYGGKGILYYTFDMLDDRFIYCDFNYRQQPGWEKTVFFPTIEDKYEVFFGKMSTENNGRADMAIKTDMNGGTWMVKLAGDTINNWNYVFNEFGRLSYTQPFIADWDHNHRYEFMALRRDSFLLVSHPLGGWKHRILLPNIPEGNLKQSLVGRNQVAAGCFNDNKDPDFCVAWPTENDSFLVRTYLDCKQIGTGWSFSTYEDVTLHKLIGLAVEADSVLWAFTTNSVYDFGRTKNRWKKSILSNPTDNESSNVDVLDRDKIQNYWMERGTLCIQDTLGTIQEYSFANGNIQYSSTNVSHSTPLLFLQGVYNATTDSYDMYGIPQKGVYGYESLTDANHRTTARYEIVKENNLFIRQTLAPIVMQSKWLGAWHANIPPNEVDSLIDVIDGNTPLIKSMNGKLLCGVFETNDTLRYLLIVNKSYLELDTCRMVMRGNFMGNIAMSPRIISGDTTLMVKFRPDSIDTVIEWENMRGGECVALCIQSHKPFHQRRCYEDFEGDNYPDISYLQFDSIHHKVCLKARYSSENYFVERELAAIPHVFSEDSKKWIWNLSACYGEDSLTDAAIFDGKSGVLHIRHKNVDSLRIDTARFYITETINNVPFCGDVNGDNLMDFSYRADNDQNLRVHLSEHGVLSSAAYNFNQYGHSLFTIPIRGDWDGNGLEDISLYRFDHKLLIDYAYNHAGLGLGSWNVVDALDREFSPSSVQGIQTICRDWDGDGFGDFGLLDISAGIFYIDLGYNTFGKYDIFVNLPFKSGEVLQQVIGDDWDQDGLDDLIYVFECDNETSSISVDIACDGFHIPNVHLNLQRQN